jgi:general stress protein YciG
MPPARIARSGESTSRAQRAVPHHAETPRPRPPVILRPHTPTAQNRKPCRGRRTSKCEDRNRVPSPVPTRGLQQSRGRAAALECGGRSRRFHFRCSSAAPAETASPRPRVILRPHTPTAQNRERSRGRRTSKCEDRNRVPSPVPTRGLQQSRGRAAALECGGRSRRFHFRCSSAAPAETARPRPRVILRPHTPTAQNRERSRGRRTSKYEDRNRVPSTSQTPSRIRAIVPCCRIPAH